MASNPRPAPVFAPHIRMSCIGRIGANAKVDMFQFGINFASIGVPNGSIETPLLINASGDTIRSDMADDVAAFFGRSATGISNQAVLEAVKFSSIGADGKLTGAPKYEVRNQAGGRGWDNRTSPQTALAVSLITNHYGPRGKGRFFLPMPQIDIDASDMKISAANAAMVNGSAEEFIEALNNNPGIDAVDFGNAGVVVASSYGANYKVVGVKVGRVIDTIRTRRNKLREDWSPRLDVD